MRIVFLLSNPDLGGIERRLSFIVPELNRRGHRARICNLCQSSRAFDCWREAGAPFDALPWVSPGRPVGPFVRLVSFLRRHRPDAVHVHGLRADILGRLAGRLAGVPVLISGQVSTEAWRRWPHVAADVLTRPLVTCYMANAEAVRLAFIRREHVAPGRIVTVHNGIDLAGYRPDERRRARLRAEWQAGPDEVVFIMVANIRPAKDHAGLLEAAARLAGQNLSFKVILVGKDFSGGAVQDDIARRGLAGRVLYIGYREDASRLLGGADVAVLCSWWEGLPFSLLEAMAAGLPVVATRVGGVGELVADGQTGVLTPPGSPGALAEAMQRMIVDPAARQRMARAGYERAATRFSLSRMVDRLELLYRLGLDVSRGSLPASVFREAFNPGVSGRDDDA